MRQRKPPTSKRAALRLPISTSSVARRAQLSPFHSTARVVESLSSDDVDTNFDLLMEIRTLVKKEKYLEQLEDQIREHNDDIDNLSDNTAASGRSLMGYKDDEARGKSRLERTQATASRTEAEDRVTPDRSKIRAVPSRASLKSLSTAREHFRACFVVANPVQFRDIQALVLMSQNLHIHHLRTLSKNLFLFSALHSVNLSDNQLDDSGSKEIRKKLAIGSISTLDLSQNLLGRLTARTICERLRHQTKLLSLNLSGNLFFSNGGDAARDTARWFAQAVAANDFLVHFSLSVPDHVEKSVSLGEQWTTATSRRGPSHKATSSNDASAITEFSHHLAQHLRQRSSLQSLGLGSAELPRRVVLQIAKMANCLTALDLSFAFIGIPGAQAVAAALRIDGYATLTQINLRCNCTQTRGARAILAALSMTERLTSLNLSHNEIRSDVVEAVINLLTSNKVLTRLDLSQNEIFGQQSEDKTRRLRDAIVDHRAVLSLGQLYSMGAIESQEREIQGALAKNRIANDHVILDSIDTLSASSPADNDTPARKRHVLSTVVELGDPTSWTMVWQRKMTKEGRLSLKWRIAIRPKCLNTSRHGTGSYNSPLVWKLIVSRKCEVHGSFEDEAATAHFHRDEHGSAYTLYSAVAYGDKGDTISLKLGVDYEDSDDAEQAYKVVVKDLVCIPHHPKDRRHLLLSIPQSLSGTRVQWRLKTQRRLVSSPKAQGVHPSSFLWEGLVQRVYIHTTGVFRLLARVHHPASLATTDKSLWWQLERSSCWDPHTSHVVLEGTYLNLSGVLRNHEVVFYLPAMEWIAGEYLQLSVTTPSDDVVLRVIQFQLFHEVANWEAPSTVSCFNFTA